jgi:hypothetical protein
MGRVPSHGAAMAGTTALPDNPGGTEISDGSWSALLPLKERCRVPARAGLLHLEELYGDPHPAEVMLAEAVGVNREVPADEVGQVALVRGEVVKHQAFGERPGLLRDQREVTFDAERTHLAPPWVSGGQGRTLAATVLERAVVETAWSGALGGGPPGHHGDGIPESPHNAPPLGALGGVELTEGPRQATAPVGAPDSKHRGPPRTRRPRTGPPGDRREPA